MHCAYDTTPRDLLDRHGDMLFRVAHYLLLERHAARFIKTVVQEEPARVMDSKRPCSERVRVLRAALSVAAHRFDFDLTRASSPPSTRLFTLREVGGDSPIAAFRQGLDQCEQMVAGLSSMHRLAFLLSEIELLTEQEIAAVFDLPAADAELLVRQAHAYACHCHTVETRLPPAELA